jgi:GT2 family glycosyltransferase
MINILILNWNSADDVANLLLSIASADYRKFRVLLIHNATNDEAEVRALYDWYQDSFEIHLILNSDNYGYAGGNNKGFDYIQHNHLDGDVLIINPDVVLQQNTLAVLVNAKKMTNAGAVMIRTFNECGKHLYDSVKLDGFKQTYCYSNKPITTTDYAAGSCILLDRNVIDNIGLFDERYFMYWEEVDLSFRIKQQGKAIVSTTESFITRKSNPAGRSANAIYYSTRNSFLLSSKFNVMTNFSLFNYLLLMLINSLLKAVNSRTLTHVKSFFNGIKNGLTFRQ